MPTVAVLPVKRFAQAKQRLAAEGGVPETARRALARSMFVDVLIALRRAREVDAVIVVAAELEAEQIAAGYGASAVEDARQDGQSAAAELGIAAAQRQGADRVVLVPGDTPALDPGELDALLRAAPAGVVVVPDRHGTGTNALVLAPPDALRPAFGPGSRARHEARAREAGVPVAVRDVPSLALDVDTGADLRALDEALQRRHGGASHTRGMLAQLRRASLTA